MGRCTYHAWLQRAPVRERRGDAIGYEADREKHFAITGFIGNGDFGKVYKATQRSTGAEGCMKVVERDVCANEGEMLKKISGPAAPECMLQLLAPPWIDSDNALCIFMERLEAPRLVPHSLETWGVLAEKTFRDVATALTYLAARTVVHNDVKPSNIGRRGCGTAVLYDYGLSHVVCAKQDWRELGDRKYIAPEANNLPLDQFWKGDAYAFGMTLKALASPTDVHDWAAWTPTGPAADYILRLTHMNYRVRASCKDFL